VCVTITKIKNLKNTLIIS